MAHAAFLTAQPGAQTEDLDRYGEFSTVVARGDPRWAGRQACLLYVDEWPVEVGITAPGSVAASGLRQLRYRREFALETAIGIDDIRSRVPEHVAPRFDDVVASGGRVPPRTRDATLASIRRIDAAVTRRVEAPPAAAGRHRPVGVGRGFSDRSAGARRLAVRAGLHGPVAGRPA